MGARRKLPAVARVLLRVDLGGPELGEALACTRAYVSKLRSGAATPSPEIAYRVLTEFPRECAAEGADLAALLGLR